MKYSLLLLTAIIFSFSSCVTQKEFTDVQEQLNNYKLKSSNADSLSVANSRMETEQQELKGEIRKCYKENEELRATNVNLNRSFQENLAKLNSIEDANSNALATSSYDNLALKEELAKKDEALDDKDREIADLNREIADRDYQIRRLENSFGETSSNISEKEQRIKENELRIKELEASIADNEATMNALKSSVEDALTGVADKDLTVASKNGKLYLSLSQELLFKSGSDVIDWKGKKALMQVADALKEHTDLDIMVEGHTDSDGSPAKNWDLSVKRATAVVKVLTTYGVEPERIAASGRALYAPIASNATSSGKAKNRRTEIILSPKLDDLYKLINE